jgi:hypothetical protein
MTNNIDAKETDKYIAKRKVEEEKIKQIHATERLTHGRVVTEMPWDFDGECMGMEMEDEEDLIGKRFFLTYLGHLDTTKLGFDDKKTIIIYADYMFDPKIG